MHLQPQQAEQRVLSCKQRFHLEGPQLKFREGRVQLEGLAVHSVGVESLLEPLRDVVTTPQLPPAGKENLRGWPHSAYH